VVLGLGGPPGAGKSTLAMAIVGRARARMGDSWAAYFPMDGYHLSNAQLKRLGLLDRKGAPNTFDIDGYVAMLSRVAADGRTDIYLPDYDRALHEPVAARLLVPAPAWRRIDHLWYVDDIAFAGLGLPEPGPCFT
jgi:pantothenate kinase